LAVALRLGEMVALTDSEVEGEPELDAVGVGVDDDTTAKPSKRSSGRCIVPPSS
jgi:hypothetical protein